MKSRFKLSLAVALALGSAPALALQLGEIRVKSALDEPLVAEIPIQLDNLTEAKDLRVGLASPADFAKAGLTRTGLDHLRFSIVSDSTGHKLVLVTSEQPVGDPFLDFLIEVDSSNGKQLREYTVLLDPVITSPPPEREAVAAAMASQPAPPVRTPVPAVQPATPAPAAAAPVAPALQPAAPQPAPSPAGAVAGSGANEYTVQRGDTLYRIASETRPDSNVSVDQMMLALQNTNPDAFYRPNINNLKSGAILRIPTRDEIQTVPAGARARAQVHRQTEDWRGGAAREATTVAGSQAPAEPAPAHAPRSEGDKLALVPPSQGGGSASTRPGEKGGTGAAEVANLQQQLASAKESLASAQQEKSELQSRVKDLEGISQKNQKLLGMKDAQIAELQNKLAQMQKANGAAAATSTATAAPVGSTASPLVAGTVGAPGNAGASAAPATAPAAAASAPPAVVAPAEPVAKRVATPAPSGTTTRKAGPATQAETPWYQRPVVWIIGAIVIVALLLLGLLRRRPRPLPDPMEEPDAPSLADQFGESPLPPQSPAQASVDPLYEPDAPYASGDAHREPETRGVEDTPATMETDIDDIGLDAPPMKEPVAEPGMPAVQPPVAGSDEITRRHEVVRLDDEEEVESPVQAAPAPTMKEPEEIHTPEEINARAASDFSDDPVDTKLDLARAYLDMGDPAGARAMLEEVLSEGSQAQKNEAKRLLESGA